MGLCYFAGLFLVMLFSMFSNRILPQADFIAKRFHPQSWIYPAKGGFN
jgi:hypothetical protein